MQKSKTTKWLWIVLAIVVLIAIVFFVWQFKGGKTVSTIASPSTLTGVAGDLDKASQDLQNLEKDFKQLDNINPSEDNAPQL